MSTEHILFAVASFLLGSIPFGVIVARARGVDIRSVGSGNIGATNVWRACGAAAGLAVFVLDVVKGVAPALAVLLTQKNSEPAFFIGMCAVLGHTFSPWLGFKGGKGIATGFGALIGSLPILAAASFVVFLVVLAASSYVSLASICAATALVIFSFLFPISLSVRIALIGFAVFVIVKHRSNIARLRAGTESKFTFRKKQDAPPQ